MNSMDQSEARARSVWIPEEPAARYEPLRGDMQADVVVVGGGICGLTTALALQRDGRQVVVVESKRIGQGTTGRSSAKLTALHRLVYDRLEHQFSGQTAQIYAAANQAGIEHVAALVQTAAIDCDFERQDAFTFTTEPSGVAEIRREADAAARAGLLAEFTLDVELPISIRGAVRVANQAQFDPYRFCVGVARVFVEEGGKIVEQTRATDVHRDDPCVVKTDRGDIRAQHVVLATLIPFMDQGGFFVRAFPSRSYAVTAKLAGSEPSAPSGMYINVESPVRSVRPLPGRRGILIVGEDHKVGHDADTRRRYLALESWTREHFEVAHFTHRWSAQDYVSADGLPFIGPLPFAAGRVMVITGLSKWGLAMGAAAARILTDLIQGREHPWSSVFDTRRTNVLASARKFVSENLDVAKRFVGDRIQAVPAKRISELKPGEGAIVADGNRRIAAYRDEESIIHAFSPICSHLGCYLQWNTAEKTWDCPCHGSRFDYEGRVLQGPAVKDLPRKPLVEPD